MMRARYPLPTDLVALVSFDGRVYPNEAKPWDRLGLDERARPLETALEQWFSFATGKHTWVSVRGATIRGLISARRRAKRSAWEVEVLIDADEDRRVISSLFSQMLAGVTRQGAERVFLRLSSDSGAVKAAREAGFFPYCRQTLYRSRQKAMPEATELKLRARARGDLFGIYQLYNQAVPANVRAIEGATFREWQAALEPWGRRPADFLLEEEGVISGWVRLLSGGIARLQVLGGSRNVPIEDLLSAGCLRLAGAGVILCLAPEYDAGLALTLERLAFRPAGDYVLMAKRLLKPAEELVPETTSTAVPAN